MHLWQKLVYADHTAKTKTIYIMNKLYMLETFNVQVCQTLGQTFAYNLFGEVSEALGSIYVQLRDDAGKLSDKLKYN